jgi:hypothetical protein
MTDEELAAIVAALLARDETPPSAPRSKTPEPSRWRAAGRDYRDDAP